VAATIVRTVLGDLEPDALGFTQPHEHLLIDLSLPLPANATATERRVDAEPISLNNYYEARREHTSEDLRLLSVDDAVDELNRYAASGGTSVVDATSIGIGRDPEGLATISRRTGVNIVMGSGFYTKDYHPADLSTRDQQHIAEEIITDIQVGVPGTAIRAGVIGEIGLSYPLHPDEAKVLRAACIAQRETGASLMIHPGRDPQAPAEALRIVTEMGVDPTRVIMSHVERTLFNAADIQHLAESGCYVSFDLFGQESSYYSLAPIDMPNDATRVDYIQELITQGHIAQLLIAQDICHKTNLVRYGGEGFTHILAHVLPLMRRKGLDQEHITTMTVDNPRTVLQFTG
jgi:phosphotriesterase-related protein